MLMIVFVVVHAGARSTVLSYVSGIKEIKTQA
jgi:hypothetical protein